jgi:hypothetical protein
MTSYRARAAVGADAVTPATQAAGDGFVTYDELRGPDLDAGRWSPACLPLPTGGEHLPLDPNAELAVGEGEVRVTIPRFSLSHDRIQAADSPKYLIVSPRASSSCRRIGPRPSPSTWRSPTSAGNRRTTVGQWPPSRWATW